MTTLRRKLLRLVLPENARQLLDAGMQVGYVLDLYPLTTAEIQHTLLDLLADPNRDEDELRPFLHNIWLLMLQESDNMDKLLTRAHINTHVGWRTTDGITPLLVVEKLGSGIIVMPGKTHGSFLTFAEWEALMGVGEIVIADETYTSLFRLIRMVALWLITEENAPEIVNDVQVAEKAARIFDKMLGL